MWPQPQVNRVVPLQTSKAAKTFVNICTAIENLLKCVIYTNNFYIVLCNFKYIFSKNLLLPISHIHLTIDLLFLSISAFDTEIETEYLLNQVLTDLKQQVLEGKIHLLRDVASRKVNAMSKISP